MDSPPPQTLQYPENHCSHVPYHCAWIIPTRTSTNVICAIQTHSLLQCTKRVVDWLTATSAVGQQNHHQKYEQIFAHLPNVWPRCSTFYRAAALNVEFSQLDRKNWLCSVTGTGSSKTAQIMARWCGCCHSKPKGVRERPTSITSIKKPNSMLNIPNVETYLLCMKPTFCSDKVLIRMLGREDPTMLLRLCSA